MARPERTSDRTPQVASKDLRREAPEIGAPVRAVKEIGRVEGTLALARDPVCKEGLEEVGAEAEDLPISNKCLVACLQLLLPICRRAML